MNNILKKLVLSLMILASMISLTINTVAFEPPISTYDIIGDTDGRAIIPATNSSPYSGILQITVSSSCNQCLDTISTGFFVSNNCFLTTAHSMKCSDHFADPDSITIKACKSSGGVFSINKTYSIDDLTIYINPNYINSTITSHDYAIVVLPENIGSTCYKFELGLLSDSEFSNQMVTVAGYIGNTFYRDTDVTYDCTATKVYYYVDAEDGQSGSPVWYQDSSGNYVVIAIHIRGGGTYNLGRRMTQALFNELASFGINV